MATIKSYSDLQQSKKLAKILPLESADMCYLPTHIGDEHHFIASLSPYSVCTKMTDVSIEYCTPCWSLAALLDFMKDKIIFGGNSPEGWFCCYTIKNPIKTLTIYEDSLIDACY